MNGRVLSVQSHVTSGYVGNKAATFPLQVLGYDVDSVNTVQYTNHAGYNRFGGFKTKPEDLSQIFDMMRKNRLLLHVTRVLTGFIPDAPSLQAVASLIKDLRKERNGDIIYLLDPVMGDDNEMYVADDVLPIYRDTLLPLADIIAPNWFEVELLTGIKLTDVRSIQSALRQLHMIRQVPNIVMSSIEISSKDFYATLAAHNIFRAGQGSPAMREGEYLLCLTSAVLPTNQKPAASLATTTRVEDSQALSIVHAVCFPKIKGYFSGVGDLFSALVLGHFKPGSSDTALADAASQALSTTQEIIISTARYCSTLSEEDCPPTDDELDIQDPERRVNRMRARELRIVSEVRKIITPPRFELVEWGGFWELA